MIDFLLNSPLLFLIWFVSLLLAIDIHEFSHALVADRLGDPTPRMNGRLSLNPLAHLDPLGTLALLLVHFGWGKPVPIDPYNLRNPRRDSALISLAGPGSNLIFIALLGLVLRIPFVYQYLHGLILLLYPLITLNVSLALFNLLPIPPLDGSKILLGFLPLDLALKLEENLNQYGFFLVLFLLFPIFGSRSLASLIISPIADFILNLVL